MRSIIFFCLLSKVLTVDVVANGDTTSGYGEDASFSCTLADMTGVLQVTWQRLYKDDSVENLATYSKRFGAQIIEPHQGRILFTKASLNSTSIIVKTLRWDDEACYICSFNAFPGGSIRKQTCLTVQGISEVSTAMTQIPPQPETDSQVMVTCSATGKPAPVITWNTSANMEGSHRTVLNDDQTVTTMSNLTLHLSPLSGGYVDCLVNEGKRGQRHEKILLPITSKDETEVEKDERFSHHWITFIIVTLSILFLLLLVFFIKRRMKNESVSCSVLGKGIV